MQTPYQTGLQLRTIYIRPYAIFPFYTVYKHPIGSLASIAAAITTEQF